MPTRAVAAPARVPPTLSAPSGLDAATPRRQKLPLTVRVEVEPETPVVGEPFTLSLWITNQGSRPTDGIYVATSGPWERYTILAVRPVGSFGRDASGWHFVSPLRIEPGETRPLDVLTRADEASDEELTFAVREAEPSETS
jgi:hypothetical protein